MVSEDGSNWNESFVVDKTTGDIDFKGNITVNGETIGNGSAGSVEGAAPMPTTETGVVGQIISYVDRSNQITLPSGGMWFVNIFGFISGGAVHTGGMCSGIYSGGSTVGAVGVKHSGFAWRIK